MPCKPFSTAAESMTDRKKHTDGLTFALIELLSQPKTLKYLKGFGMKIKT